MKYLGCHRVVSLDFENHITAEDYVGYLGAPISLKGNFKVKKVISSYRNMEDTFCFQDFLTSLLSGKNKITSLTGKEVLLTNDLINGNVVELEREDGLLFMLSHLGEVFVKVGGFVSNETIIGTEGNTGVVLSNMKKSDKGYGHHIQVEVKDQLGNVLNPRKFVEESSNFQHLFTSRKSDTYFLKLMEGEALFLLKRD